MLPPSARLSALALAAVVVLYAVFAGVPAGRELDAAVVERDLDWSWEWAARLPAQATRPQFVVLAVGVLCWLALRDRRPGDALRVVALTAAAGILARGVEEALEALDPVGGETARALGAGFYPSGHAAVAMSVALGALIVAPAPVQGRGLVLAATAWAGLAGWGIVADAGHHPSDVVGGLLLATAIAGVLVLGRRPLTGARAALPWGAIAAVIAFLLASCVALALIDELRISHSVFQPVLIGFGIVIVLITLALVQAFERVLATGTQRC